MINLEILKNYLYYKHFKQYFTTVLEFELSLLFNDISFKNRLDFKFFFQQDNTHIQLKNKYSNNTYSYMHLDILAQYSI